MTRQPPEGETVKPYTDADVERVARSMFDADQRRLVAKHAHLPGVTPGRWSDMLADTRRLYEDRSRAVLDALAAAGRLLPTDDDLTERLAGVVADMLSQFTGDRSGAPVRSLPVSERQLAAWRAVYAEWADRVAPEGTDAPEAPRPVPGDNPSPECQASLPAVHADCDNDMGCTCSCHRSAP